jgi:hypothetical protein
VRIALAVLDGASFANLRDPTFDLAALRQVADA